MVYAILISNKFLGVHYLRTWRTLACGCFRQLSARPPYIKGVRLLVVLLLRLPVGRGGVLNSPRFCFFFIRCRSRSWGIPLAFLCCLATATHHLNPFYSRIVQQNRHFNMYTKISKRKQGSRRKKFHQRCFETTNFDRLHRKELLFVSR